MFALVIFIPGQADGAEAVREAHVRYSELAAKHPGILYKHVMQSKDDPTHYFDVMVWAAQNDSEKFGIDPEYQKHRAGPMRIPAGPRAWMNPGYYREVWELGHTTSQETSQSVGYYEVTPGLEQVFEEAAAHARDLVAGRVSSLILYRNLGKPNQYAIVAQGLSPDDEKALTPLADFTVNPPEIDHGEIIVRYDFR